MFLRLSRRKLKDRTVLNHLLLLILHCLLTKSAESLLQKIDNLLLTHLLVVSVLWQLNLSGLLIV